VYIGLAPWGGVTEADEGGGEWTASAVAERVQAKLRAMGAAGGAGGAGGGGGGDTSSQGGGSGGGGGGGKGTAYKPEGVKDAAVAEKQKRLGDEAFIKAGSGERHMPRHPPHVQPSFTEKSYRPPVN